MPVHPGTTSRRPTARAVARRAALGTAAASIAVVGLPAVALAAPPSSPFISEIHYDNAGTDTGEFVEVQFPEGTSSTGWRVVLYNAATSNTYPLVGSVYDDDVLPDVAGPGVALLEYGTNGVQNGSPDGVALVDPAGAVAEFLSYEGTFTASYGPAAGLTSTDIGVAEDGTDAAGLSLSRTYDADADALVWNGPAASTPGAVNGTSTVEPEQPIDACAVTPTHEIGAVQGAGATTPLAGQQVAVQGVVVGDLPDMSGFFLQDPDGDGDAATSDGIFVFSSLAVDLGDTVSVTGTAEERYGQTQINAGAGAEVCTEGTTADLPDASTLDLPADDAARERLEGMLVQPADALTVSEVYDLTRYGDLTLSEGGVLVQPTEMARPGAAAEAVATDNTLRRIVLDDAVSGELTPSTAPYLSPDDPVRVGDELTLTEPLVMGFGFSQWRLFPADGSAEGVFAPQNTRQEAPHAVGGDIQVGAFNVLNYFLTFDRSVGRGAENQAEFEEQAAKIVPAIDALGTEIVTLMEIEDTDSTGYTPGDADTALADLVARLNAHAGGGDTWAYVPMPQELYAVDRDVIRNAIIYQPAAVTPVGDPVGLVDEANFDNAREPIAQTFEAQGDAFTVIANHLKSKSPGTPSGDNVDAGDGQGAWNGDRVRQAQSLAAFVEQLRTTTGDDDVMVLGDLNAYSQEDPIEVLREAGLTDLGTQFDEGRYSYVYDDMSGSLDHAMATDSLTAKVTDVAHWNINAVESYAYQYVGDPELYAADPFRSSDHDPLVVGLDLAGAGAGDGITELQLLGINDFHGRLADAVAVAGTVEEQRARADVDATLLLSAGDNIGATPFVSSVQQDEPTIEVLDQMGLKASAVGNHEFDRGFTDLVDRVGIDGASGLADFDYLGANVYGEDGRPVLKEYALLDAAGVTVGVIGVVTQETSSLVSPAGIEGITFGDPVAATNRVVGELTDGTGDEADVIVLLAHEGAPRGDSLEDELAADTAFAAIVDGVDAEVDAIFTGHTHQSYAWEAPVPGGDDTRPVVQTGSYGDALGRIVLTYEEATDDVTAFTVENLPITERTEEDLVAAYPGGAQVAETVAAAQAYADEVGSQVIGSVTTDITRAFTTGQDGEPVEDRGSYSPLGGLVADTYVYGSELSAIEPADLGLVNPGGLRGDLLYGQDGQITSAEANDVTPFANDLVVVTLTGAQLVQVLEQQWQPEASSRPFLALGTSQELTWSYDPEAAAGERIIVDSIRISDEPIDLGATYRVATNSFLASGGDNFTTFAEGTTEQTGLIDFDAFQAYLEEFSPLKPEDYTGRVTLGEAEEPAPDAGVTVSPTTFAARDRVTLSVSEFGPSERVVVTLDGDRLGRIRTDADGAGSVTVRIPRGVEAGPAEIVATGTDSDRTATVPVEITGGGQPGNGNGSVPTLGELLNTLQELLRNLLRGWFGG